MDIGQYGIIFLCLIIIFFIQSQNIKRKVSENISKQVKRDFGKKNERKYKHDEYERIKYYFKYYIENNSGLEYIDEVTWNDLGMDDIYKMINNTMSSVGEEVLYKNLRILKDNKKELDDFDKISEYFMENQEKAMEIEKIYGRLGRTRSISFFEFLHKLTDIKKRSNFLNYLSIIFVFATVLVFLFNPSVGVFVSVGVLSFNIFTYYREKNQINNYFVCTKYLVGLIDNIKKISDKNIEGLAEYNKRINDLVKDLSYLKRGMFLIPEGGVNDSLAGMILEYFRFIFHLDLIKFNSLINKTKENIDKIDELYEIAGVIESGYAVASFKNMLKREYGFYCRPVFLDETKISFENIVHPFINNAVANSMQGEKNILLTGSNASGKSTFLKTVGINSILAQTINIAAAKEFKINFTGIYSSMALKDDLVSKESYYIVEIKSLKRILDKAVEKPILCFVDEVLRGTNTVERIAASSEILKELGKMDTLCFAATHDIELTKLLENGFSNYHFQENIVDGEVLFNYNLNKGPAATKNAIKLLETIGYSKEIITNSNKIANDFLSNGKWY